MVSSKILHLLRSDCSYIQDYVVELIAFVVGRLAILHQATRVTSRVTKTGGCN
jgi:hypothetical protein